MRRLSESEKAELWDRFEPRLQLAHMCRYGRGVVVVTFRRGGD